MKSVAIINITVFLAGLVSAAPTEKRAVDYVDFEYFTVDCNATQCNYSSIMRLLPQNHGVLCASITDGPTVIPVEKVRFVCSDSGVSLQLEKVTEGAAYRFSVVDSRDVAGPKTFSYVSAVADWTETAYIGSQTFRLE